MAVGIDEQVSCGRLGAVPVAQIILSSLTLIVALITGFLVWKANIGATDQRELQAKREEWWRRFQYAAELALDENNERRANIGVLMVRKMVTSTLAGPDELAAADVILDEVLALGDTDSEDSTGSAMTDSTPQGAAHVTDAQINAARTKLIIDKKLKRASKPQIKRLAQLKTSGERRLIAS